ncbi:hypothetical protein AVEN_73045-1 [Araneus ventricosus]|uniref:Uncharacterized protein n=1 Tax=Araneus ventricosus TaxID=182803 RepID=A0A4Y2FC46_ARAVE|nr:hypothetical protein AVEN_73045-1 [Araneus ventricosus]
MPIFKVFRSLGPRRVPHLYHSMELPPPSPLNYRQRQACGVFLLTRFPIISRVPLESDVLERIALEDALQNEGHERSGSGNKVP